MITKYTNRDFELYVTYVLMYLDLYGCKDYHVEFRHEQLSEGTFASVDYFIEAKRAVFKLSKVVDSPATARKMMQTAHEEVLHLVFAEYTHFANVVKDQYDVLLLSLEHSIINKIIHAMEV